MSAQVKADDGDIILEINKDLSEYAYSLLALVNGKILVYKIFRRQAHRDKKIVTLLNAITDHLTQNFHFAFFGIFWGKPSVIYYRNLRILTLNNTRLYREDGYLYPTMTEGCKDISWDTLDKTELVNYIDYYTFKKRGTVN